MGSEMCIRDSLLTSLLTPLLLAGAERSGKPGMTRVVNVTSLGYRLSPLRFHDYNFEGKPIPIEEEPPSSIPAYMKPAPGREYYAFTAYGQSKTANILHAVSLNEKLGSRGVKAFAVHPGCKSLVDIAFWCLTTDFKPASYLDRSLSQFDSRTEQDDRRNINILERSGSRDSFNPRCRT